MASTHTSKALSSVTANAPKIITQLVRADDRGGSQRLEHLYEAQRLILTTAAEIQDAITIEQQRCGEAAAPLIAARLRAVAQQQPRK